MFAVCAPLTRVSAQIQSCARRCSTYRMVSASTSLPHAEGRVTGMHRVHLVSHPPCPSHQAHVCATNVVGHNSALLPQACYEYGMDTLLLVEDEPLVRGVASRVLREQGYTVLEATNGVDALRMAREHANEEIHLLLTDVAMPLMGGRDLAERLRAQRPGIKVLFISGYTDDALVSPEGLETGTDFLQKPFTPEELTQKVRRVLESEPDT